MQRGVKTECESLAVAVRGEMGASPTEPLDPRDLANHLGVPVHPLTDLRGDEDLAMALRHVLQQETSILSALTIFPRWPAPHRIVLYNDAHGLPRQNSDISHELAHGLRMHQPRCAVVNGCRDYSKTDEEEAAWLGGCLLVPRTAALSIVRSGETLPDAAARFGVSEQMMRWRINHTGVRRQVSNGRRLGADRIGGS